MLTGEPDFFAFPSKLAVKNPDLDPAVPKPDNDDDDLTVPAAFAAEAMRRFEAGPMTAAALDPHAFDNVGDVPLPSLGWSLSDITPVDPSTVERRLRAGLPFDRVVRADLVGRRHRVVKKRLTYFRLGTAHTLTWYELHRRRFLLGWRLVAAGDNHCDLYRMALGREEDGL